MPRPCQQRRASASAAANRKARANPKPAGPPPIQHKKRQKAIHNARRGRGRGGRAQNGGGRPSRNQQSGNNEMNQDFISLSSGGNNFGVLHRGGSRHTPITLDDMDDSLEDGELTSDNGTDSDDLDDSDMHDTEDMMQINFQEQRPMMSQSRGTVPRPQVMFTVRAAMIEYSKLRLDRLPIIATNRTRYGLFLEDTSPDTSAYISSVPSPLSRQASVSSATSDEVVATSESKKAPKQEKHMPGRDYVFDWGQQSGKHFLSVPDTYLKTIGGQLYRYIDAHPGLKEAFEYHRPELARLGAGQPTGTRPAQAQTQQPQAQSQSQTQSRRPPPRGRQNAQSNALTPSDTYMFNKGPHKGQRLHDVDEQYIRSMEGMLVNNKLGKYPGFREALQDFNAKTGRNGRV